MIKRGASTVAVHWRRLERPLYSGGNAESRIPQLGLTGLCHMARVTQIRKLPQETKPLRISLLLLPWLIKSTLIGAPPSTITTSPGRTPLVKIDLELLVLAITNMSGPATRLVHNQRYGPNELNGHAL